MPTNCKVVDPEGSPIFYFTPEALPNRIKLTRTSESGAKEEALQYGPGEVTKVIAVIKATP